MKYLLLLLALAFSISGVFAQNPDHSSSIKITWPKDPDCYSGSRRGRPVIINNTLCAENGSRLRGDHIYMLPKWKGCWDHNLDSNTWKDMRDKRYLNCVRLLLYQPPLMPEGEEALTIPDAVKYSKIIHSLATHFGFYVIVNYHSGSGYDSTRVKRFFQAMCAEFADDENVIFQTQSEPVWAPHIPDAYTNVEKDFTVSIWKQIRGWAPESPIILWEFLKVEPGTSTFKDVIDSRPAIDYSNTVVGWHGYHAGFDTSLVGNGLKRFYPVMMTEMQRTPPKYGSGDYGAEVAKLEAMECSWITLAAFPFYDPHEPIKATVNVTQIPPPSALIAPADNSVETASPVRFTWEAVSGATGYRLQVGTDEAFTQLVTDRSGLSTQSFTVDALAKGTMYHWRVAACNAAGTSPWSPTWSFTTDADASEGKNILDNSDFDAGTSAWTFYTNGTGSMQQVSPGFDDNLAVALFITQIGSNTQLYQHNIPLQVNARYRLSFAAYSTGGHGLEVVLQKHGAPYGNYGLNKHFLLSTVWAQYSVEFTASVTASVSDARLMFWLGPSAVSGDQYWFDHVVLERISATATTPPDEAPAACALLQNYPNPFNPSTVISSQLPIASDVKLVVYDVVGREVAVLVDEHRAAGQYQDTFSAEGISQRSGGGGRGLASGVYIYRLTAGSFVQSRRMILMK